MSYALSAVVVTRAGERGARVRTFALTVDATSARRELVEAIDARHRAPFVEAEDDVEEGRQVPVEAFVDLDVSEGAGLVNGAELGPGTLAALLAVRDHVAAALGRGELVETYVELT